MNVNEAIMINAKVCRTCGMRWLYEVNSESIILAKDHIVTKNRQATPSERSGGYDRHDLVFVPTEAGKYSILMTESRLDSFEEVYETHEDAMVYIINLHVN